MKRGGGTGTPMLLVAIPQRPATKRQKRVRAKRLAEIAATTCPKCGAPLRRFRRPPATQWRAECTRPCGYAAPVKTP